MSFMELLMINNCYVDIRNFNEKQNNWHSNKISN